MADSQTQVSPQYDENGGVSYYYSMPTGTDSDGNTVYRQIPVSADQITTTYQSNFDPETGSSWQTPTYSVPTSAVNKEVDKYTPPPVDPNYKRSEAVQQSGLFTNQPGQGENINSFSGGYFGNIYDAINSGAYKVSPDKSQLISPYGTFNLTPVGNNLYDIYVPAKSGSYRTTVGVSDSGKAVLNQDMIDKGAIRYVGGSSGGFFSGMLNDLGPIANIGLAAFLGPEAGFLTQAGSQTALNLAKGQDLQDALTRGVISGGITTGINALTGAGVPDNYGSAGSQAAADAVYGGATIPAWESAYSGVGYEGLGGGLGGGEPQTLYGAAEGAFPGTEPGTVALDQDMATMAGAGGAGLAGSALAGGGGGGALAGAAGLTAADLLKYAAIAGVASKVLGGNKTPSAGTGGGPDQTPVGGGLSPSYKPYRYQPYAAGGATSAGLSAAAQHYNLGGYSDGGRLLRGPGDGVSDSIPATIGEKRQPARLADGEFVVPARIVSELGNGSTEAGARKLYAMMERIQAARKNTVGKGKVAKNTRADKHLPA